MQKPSVSSFFFLSLVMGAGAVATCLSSRQVFAGDSTTVAVLGIEAGDGVPESIAGSVTDALRQHMSISPGFRLVQGRDLVEVKLVFSCPDEAPACMGQAAKSLGAARLIFGTVKKASSDTFNITLKLFNSDKDVVESWTSDQFAQGQANSAGLRGPVQKWIATLTGESVPGTVRVQGGVVGAAVALDGVGAGVMSASGFTLSGVAAGKHEITLTKAGYAAATKSVTLGSGDTREVAIEMVAETAPAGASPAQTSAGAATEIAGGETAPVVAEQVTGSGSGETRVATRVAAWLTLAGGVAGIAVGIRYSLLVSQANSLLDPHRRFACKASATGLCNNQGKPAEEPSDDELAWMKKTSDNAHRYQTYQWIGYGVGAALLATSSVFFYRGYVSRPSGATADARGSSWQLAPMFAPNALGAAAFATF